MNPVFDEARGVRGLATATAQPRLQDGKWAELAEPSLNHDNTDCDQVCNTERQRIDPTPVPHAANEHEDQAADDEGNNREVQEKNRIRKPAVEVRDLHLRSLTFELRRDRRQDARPGPVKMYSVPPARAWWLAVGPRLERGVRPHWSYRAADQ